MIKGLFHQGKKEEMQAQMPIELEVGIEGDNISDILDDITGGIGSIGSIGSSNSTESDNSNLVIDDTISSISDNSTEISNSDSGNVVNSGNFIAKAAINEAVKYAIYDDNDHVPIYTFSHRDNRDLFNAIVSSDDNCRRLRRLTDQFRHFAKHTETGYEISRVRDSLRREMKLGMSLHSFTDFLNCAYCHDESSVLTVFKTLPFKACEARRKFERIIYDQFLNDKQATRLASGSLIREIYQNFASVDFKMMVYLTHDSIIRQLNYALQTEEYDWPPYSANVILEKYSLKKQPFPLYPTIKGYEEMEKYVRIIYNGKVLSLPWFINPQDPTLCPWSNFLAFIGDLLPHQYEDECKVYSPHSFK